MKAGVPGRLLVALPLLAGLGAAAHGLRRLLELRAALEVVLGGAFTVLAVALGAALLATAVALVRLPSPGPALRGLVVVSVAAWLLFLRHAQPYQGLWLALALGVTAGAWALLLLAAPLLARLPPRLARAGDVLLFSLALAIPGLELGLRGAALLRPSPLLARVASSPTQVMLRQRFPAGTLRFGFPCNSGGHYDEEFRRKAPGERLVVTIGDSFSLGTVPHAWHYTTVCERALAAPVHNMGIAGTGPPEYLRMLADEALPLDPDVVVVAVFVGNDLGEAVTVDARGGALRDWLDRDRVLLWVLPRRLARVAEERRQREGADPVADVAGGARGGPAHDPASLEQIHPWLLDPMLEPATISEAGFLRIESARALEVCAGGSLERFFGTVLEMRATAAGKTLCVLLVPDEFQVEDDVWREVQANLPGAQLERDRPQRLIVPWMEREGIPCLDLLPVLRAAEPLADGRRHVYHLRDTHFNARGNRIVGEALAEFLRPFLR